MYFPRDRITAGLEGEVPVSPLHLATSVFLGESLPQNAACDSSTGWAPKAENGSRPVPERIKAGGGSGGDSVVPAKENWDLGCHGKTWLPLTCSSLAS